MGMKEYHGWQLDKSNLKAGPISCSMIKRFADNPYAWRWGPEFKQTAAMATGTILDAALTDPSQLNQLIPLPDIDLSKFAIAPFKDFRTKEAQKWRDERESEGMEVVSEKTFEEIKIKRDINIAECLEKRSSALQAAEAVRNHKIAGPLLDGAELQVGVIGEIHGIPAKCLLDILPASDESIVDYKTTSTGLDDRSISQAIGKYRYHWQGVFYKTLFNDVSADRHIESFKLIFQDTTTLEVRVVTLSDDAMALGTQSLKLALKEFARCAKRGIRSRYETTDDEVGLMPYHAMSEDEWNCTQEDFAQ